MREAMLWKKLENNRVECQACAQRCVILPGLLGVCRVRQNRDGTLYSLVYGQVVAANVDPIEKKPLFHFLPGSTSFSIATVGCNFHCLFCQNADISQAPKGKNGCIFGQYLPPEEVVAGAIRAGCASISYTYTEPTIFIEYAYDTSRLAHDQGIKNVFVSNGYMTHEAIELMHGYLDAANIDLKSFRDATYRKVMGAKLQPVLDAITELHRIGVWLELTTLIVPDLNDSDEELRDIAAWIAGIDTSILWHISRFYPQYKMTDRPPTPVAAIHRAVQIGREAGLQYVYAGNVPGNEYESTRCPQCSTVVIRRYGYDTHSYLKGDRCPSCGYRLAMIV